MSLRLDFCSRAAADFACRRDHYTGGLPAGRMQTIGCWEDGVFVGAIVFSRGACKDLATRFGFKQTEVVELTRVALAQHRTPTTRMVAIALRLLKAANPGLQAVISFSDPAQLHNGRPHSGRLYRAGGWWFLGMTHAEAMLRVAGVLRHRRTIISKFRTGAVSWLRQNVDRHAERVIMPPKSRFAMPLTDEARQRLRPHVQPYPKSREQSAESGTLGSTRKGRIDTTCSLHLQDTTDV